MPSERHFYDLARLQNRQNRKGLCIGLDSDIELIRQQLPKTGINFSARASDADKVAIFTQHVVGATADIAGCFKPNSSFYETLGRDYYFVLRKVVSSIHSLAPNVPIIDDAKRGDIGNTNRGYVASILEELGFDALTVSPYLGGEALSPFMAKKNKGIIILGRTSNPGAADLQSRDFILNRNELHSLLNGSVRSFGEHIPENGTIEEVLVLEKDEDGRDLLVPHYKMQ